MIGLMPLIAPGFGAPIELVSDTTGPNYPTLQDDDFAVLLDVASGASQFLSAVAVPDVLASSVNSTIRYSARIAAGPVTAAMSGTAIGGNSDARRLLIFRRVPPGPISRVTVLAVGFNTTFSGSMIYTGQPTPILPIFGVVAVGPSTADPTITFDGVAPTFFSASVGGAFAKIGLLLGPQPARTIDVNLNISGSASRQYTGFNLRRP